MFRRWIALLCVALLPTTTLAATGTEVVLVLDNSGSLVHGATRQTQMPNGSIVESTVPPADPDRLAILATLLLNGLVDRDDRLTILSFASPQRAPYLQVPAVDADIRELTQLEGTYFAGPLTKARELLSSSDKPRRLLLLMTDGAPMDIASVDQARQLLGLDAGPAPFDIVSIALAGDDELRTSQQVLLDASKGGIGEYVPVTAPNDLVREFTRVYARTLRSRPEPGSLKPGGSFSFDVPRYVSEVLVFVASEQRSGAFEARLETDRGQAKPSRQGDNGCSAASRMGPVRENPRLCVAPFHHYQVFKQPHDPDKSSRWTLSLPNAKGAVSYGIVLRYDLVADVLQSVTSAHVGDEIEVRARLTYRGRTFDDAQFFESDGFQASATLGGQEVPLVRQPDHTFVARLRPDREGRLPLTVRFQNRWLDLSTSAPDVLVEGWAPLVLRANPSTLDFGAWTGTDRLEQRCVTIDLAGSEGIDRVPLELAADSLPAGLMLAAPGVDTASMVVPVALDGTKATVCLAAPPCCTEASIGPADGIQFQLRGANPHYHPTALRLPVTTDLGATPWWVCWWKWIASSLGLVAFGLVVYGFVSPRDFDPDDVIRMARNESALSRAVARRLVELPGGRRGFYRHARVAFDGTGNALPSPKGAVLSLVANAGDPVVAVRGTLERKDPRTRQWVAVAPQDVADSVRRGQVYRVGDFYFRLG